MAMTMGVLGKGFFLPFSLLCLFMASSLALAYTNQEDVYALNVLFSILNKPPLTGWVRSGGDPCSENWQGVACTGSAITSLILSGTNLIGALGYSLANLTSLVTLDLSNNLLSSVIPYQLPPHMQQLILSGNHFSGNLPYSLMDLSNLNILNVSNNKLSGEIPDAFGQSTPLSTLDLSNNRFNGQLPQSFGDLTRLSILYLQGNQLNGTIDILSSLPLKDLDISNNDFIGSIPASLTGIPRINFYGNQISIESPSPPGSPPKVSQVSPPNPKQSITSKAGNKHGGHTALSPGHIAGIAVASVLGMVTLVLVLLAFPWRKCKRSSDEEEPESRGGSPWRGSLISQAQGGEQKEEPEPAKQKEVPAVLIKPPPPPPPPPPSEPASTLNLERASSSMSRKTNIAARAFTIADLQLATNSFSQENLVGKGSLGCVYKASFSSGEVLAIKRLDSLSISDEDFSEMLLRISRLRHPNIVQLVGFCVEHGEHLLAYKFVAKDTLHCALHYGEEAVPLTWNARVNIALGVSRALQYLHEGSRLSIVHQNIKSSNILLNEELNPLVSDCGLASFMSNHQVTVQHSRSSGYNPPEWEMSGFYSAKSDVYSFGVILLELMTAREPFDRTKPRVECSLVQWATPQLYNIAALENMADPALKGTYTVKELLHFADVIARCVQVVPDFRPSMSEVTHLLESFAR